VEGSVSVVLRKHGELSPDETILKPVNIFKDTTHYKKWFHLQHCNNETQRAVMKGASVSDLQFFILWMINIKYE
jgi:hypothetical protein